MVFSDQFLNWDKLNIQCLHGKTVAGIPMRYSLLIRTTDWMKDSYGMNLNLNTQDDYKYVCDCCVKANTEWKEDIC